MKSMFFWRWSWFTGLDVSPISAVPKCTFLRTRISIEISERDWAGRFEVTSPIFYWHFNISPVFTFRMISTLGSTTYPTIPKNRNVIFTWNSQVRIRTWRVWDQCTTTALFVSLLQAAKKACVINGAHKLSIFCQQIIEWSSSGVE